MHVTDTVYKMNTKFYYIIIVECNNVDFESLDSSLLIVLVCNRCPFLLQFQMAAMQEKPQYGLLLHEIKSFSCLFVICISVLLWTQSSRYKGNIAMYDKFRETDNMLYLTRNDRITHWHCPNYQGGNILKFYEVNACCY